MKSRINICLDQLVFLTGFLLLVAAGSPTLWAQNDQDEELETPDPEQVELRTKDGFTLSAIWYAPRDPEAGKETAPVLLVHDFGSSCKKYGNGSADDSGIARWLQEAGFAVLMADLRGHGNSKTDPQGNEIDLDRVGKRQLPAYLEDLEACKRFLVRKNNEGEVNIQMLTMIVAGEMSVIGAEWVNRDWLYAYDSRGNRQGADVRALIMLGPKLTCQGVKLLPSLKKGVMAGRGAAALPTMILVGGNSRARGEVDDMTELMERTRGRDLFNKTVDVKRTSENADGEDLLAMQRAPAVIKQYIEDNVLEMKDSLRWEKRD